MTRLRHQDARFRWHVVDEVASARRSARRESDEAVVGLHAPCGFLAAGEGTGRVDIDRGAKVFFGDAKEGVHGADAGSSTMTSIRASAESKSMLAARTRMFAT